MENLKKLTEGDLLTVFSQWGEIANINLVRDKETGKSKGFVFMNEQDGVTKQKRKTSKMRKS